MKTYCLLMHLHSASAWKVPREYPCVRTAPYHPRIHNMGNVGVGGWIHAKMARYATKIIDDRAYGGRNMRHEFAQLLKCQQVPPDLIEVGCGVGTLTQELSRMGYFERLRAFDTSEIMISEARAFARKNDMKEVEFDVRNACDVGTLCAGVAVSSFMMHELPTEAHVDVVRSLLECTRQPGGQVWIMDIDTTYVPSPAMLSGEPYVEAYIDQIDGTMSRLARDDEGVALSNFLLFRGHVRVWRFEHVDAAKGTSTGGSDHSETPGGGLRKRIPTMSRLLPTRAGDLAACERVDVVACEL